MVRNFFLNLGHFNFFYYFFLTERIFFLAQEIFSCRKEKILVAGKRTLWKEKK